MLLPSTAAATVTCCGPTLFNVWTRGPRTPFSAYCVKQLDVGGFDEDELIREVRISVFSRAFSFVLDEFPLELKPRTEPY